MRYESASPRRAVTIGEWTGHLPRVLAVLRGGEPLSARSMPAYDWMIVSDIAALVPASTAQKNPRVRCPWFSVCLTAGFIGRARREGRPGLLP